MKLITLLASGLRSATNALGLTSPPTKQVTVFDVRSQPTGIVQFANVERIHSIMEAADAGDTRDLFALYQEIVLTDNHMQAEFSKRKLALLGDPMSIIAANKKDAMDAKAAEVVSEQIADCRGFLKACIHLMDSVLWPVSVVEKVFVRSGSGFRLAELVPVPDQLLDFNQGEMRIRLTDERGMPTGTFADVDPARYIVHRGHLLTFADHRGGPLRSLVWWWLLTTMDREWWGRFLDRFGAPFLVGKYEQSDDASRSVLERAFSYATRIGGLVVSRETDVEIQQASASQTGDAFEKFMAVGQREKSKLIVGQTLSAESQPLGIGGGASGQHEQVRQDIRQWDAMQLGETLRTQLFDQMLLVNGMAGKSPKVIWGGEDSAGQEALGKLLESLSKAGLQLTDEAIGVASERFGLGIQRAAAVPAPTMLGARVHLLTADKSALAADDANAAIARAGSAGLTQAFSGALAPVRQAVLESTSAADLEHRLHVLYADWPAERLAGVIENALVAYAANGVSLLTNKK